MNFKALPAMGLPTKRCALGTERFSGNNGGFEVITAESLQKFLADSVKRFTLAH